MSQKIQNIVSQYNEEREKRVCLYLQTIGLVPSNNY